MGAAIGRTRLPTVIVLGLDNSGKTTVVNWLREAAGHDSKVVVPSVGVSVQKLQGKSVRMAVCDVSGL